MTSSDPNPRIGPSGRRSSSSRNAFSGSFSAGLEAIGEQPAVGTQPGYQPAEIISTLLAARRDLELPDGHWPSQWEYSEWAEVKRRLTRRSGKGPRIPGLKPIRKAFGGYDSAVEAASRHFDGPR